MAYPASPKQPDIEPHTNVNQEQIKWYREILSLYFSDTKDHKKMKELSELEHINVFTKKFSFPEFQCVTIDMTIEQKTKAMKNLFLIIIKIYEKLEHRFNVDLSTYKNHARVLEQFEDMPQYLMKKIDEDFKSVEKLHHEIKLPTIPFQHWPNG